MLIANSQFTPIAERSLRTRASNYSHLQATSARCTVHINFSLPRDPGAYRWPRENVTYDFGREGNYTRWDGFPMPGDYFRVYGYDPWHQGLDRSKISRLCLAISGPGESERVYWPSYFGQFLASARISETARAVHKCVKLLVFVGTNKDPSWLLIAVSPFVYLNCDVEEICCSSSIDPVTPVIPVNYYAMTTNIWGTTFFIKKNCNYLFTTFLIICV